MRQVLRIGAALGCVALLASCEAYHARAYAGFMRPVLSGDLGLSDIGSGVSGTVTTENSLGVEESATGYVRADAGVSVLNVTGSGFLYDESGRGTLEASFGGITAMREVETDARIALLKLAATFDLLDFDVFRLSPGIGVDYVDLDVEVRDEMLGLTERLEAEAPLPLPLVQAELDLGDVAAILDVGGIAVDLDEVDGTFFDVEGLLRYEPVSHVEIFAGYRWVQIDAEGETDDQRYDADLTLQGFMVGGGVTF